MAMLHLMLQYSVLAACCIGHKHPADCKATSIHVTIFTSGRSVTLILSKSSSNIAVVTVSATREWRQILCKLGSISSKKEEI